MPNKTNWFGLLLALLVLAAPATAHFQVLVPSDDIVEAEEEKRISLETLFTHPMDQGPVMEMGTPQQFGVFFDGQKHDLRERLREKKIDGKTAYDCTYPVERPGDYVFYIEPAPYWEPAERKMIVHYTKVVVDAFGAEEGWDAMVGFPVEIQPLVRPYGLWTGNIFRGVVKRDGEPVPFAEVEVEYLNTGNEVKVPSAPFVTQVIRADRNGVFTYAMPRDGWWGFAALVEGDARMENPDGEKVGVELGALMWVKTTPMR